MGRLAQVFPETPSSGPHVLCSKLATVGVFIPGQLANTTNKGGLKICFFECWLLNIYQHTADSSPPEAHGLAGKAEVRTDAMQAGEL